MKKIYRNRSSIYHIAVVCLFAILFTVSCSKDSVVDEPDNNDIKDKAEYHLEIGDKVLVGKNIDSNWDSELGIVWLGTDENELPTGTLTVTIDTIVTSSSGRNQAWVSSATLSHVDKLVGTSSEINAKTYFSLEKDAIMKLIGTPYLILYGVEIGANYISGSITYKDISDEYGWPLKETTTGTVAELKGTFTAIVERP
jgi:hypothetical protein